LAAARINAHRDIFRRLVADKGTAGLPRIAAERVNRLTSCSDIDYERLLQRVVHLDSQSVFAANQRTDLLRLRVIRAAPQAQEGTCNQGSHTYLQLETGGSAF
jgi:hypothetical protein